MINIYNPNIKPYTKSAIEAINEGWISNHGKYIQLANDKLKLVTKTQYSILMANGTCATHCLFLALKYKYPTIDKIYVPGNCYVAAWNAALMVYDESSLVTMKMNYNTWNIDTNEEYIKSLEPNSAIFIVHNLGNIVNVPRLKSIRPDIIFIEDNCEGFLGKYNNIYSGMGECTLCSSCSFYGNKIITTGEGGSFFTQDESTYNHIKLVYSQGVSDKRYLHKIHAFNYRMTNIEAAFLYDQLNDIDNILTTKNTVFRNYNNIFEKLKQIGKLNYMTNEMNTIPAQWIYGLQIIGNKLDNDDTISFFKTNNVDIRPFFYPINAHYHLSNIKPADSVSSTLNKEVIMIPSSPNMLYTDQLFVASVIYKFLFKLQNIEVIDLDKSNHEHIYNEFLSKIKNEKFRYFDKRRSNCISNHLKTSVLYDCNTQTFIGYSHIDEAADKLWFGIYIDPSHQSKKLGVQLLSYMLLCPSIIDKDLFLTVDIDNFKAINLYKKNGFVITKTTNSYHEMKFSN